MENLREIVKNEFKSIDNLSKKLGVTNASVFGWLSGRREMPAEYCIKIYELSRRRVKLEWMRPDINWGYLKK